MNFFENRMTRKYLLAVLSALAMSSAQAFFAVHTARLIEASPDFVGLTDVAEVLGMSRQNMRKLMTTNSTTFPIPVLEGSSSVWHLFEVLGWLQTKGDYRIESRLLEVAEAAMQVNLVKEMEIRRLQPSAFQEELRLLLS
jgi:predicted DNA-binding transcriptional regulator AlpA